MAAGMKIIAAAGQIFHALQIILHHKKGKFPHLWVCGAGVERIGRVGQDIADPFALCKLPQRGGVCGVDFFCFAAAGLRVKTGRCSPQWKPHPSPSPEIPLQKTDDIRFSALCFSFIYAIVVFFLLPVYPFFLHLSCFFFQKKKLRQRIPPVGIRQRQKEIRSPLTKHWKSVL